jgi:hypothetical protein
MTTDASSSTVVLLAYQPTNAIGVRAPPNAWRATTINMGPSTLNYTVYDYGFCAGRLILQHNRPSYFFQMRFLVVLCMSEPGCVADFMPHCDWQVSHAAPTPAALDASMIPSADGALPSWHLLRVRRVRREEDWGRAPCYVLMFSAAQIRRL